MSKSVVLDSFALICLFQQEPGFDKVEAALRLQEEQSSQALLNIINWGEFYYIVFRRLGADVASKSLELIEQLPIRIVPADQNLVRRAAEIKATYPLSYADAFAVATANLYKAPVMTSDPEFKTVEQLVDIDWL